MGVAKMRHIGYARLSSVDRRAGLSLPDILPSLSPGFHSVFIEKATSREHHRPEWAACLRSLRPGDMLHVSSMPALANSLEELRSRIGEVFELKADIRFVAEDVDFTRLVAADQYGRLKLNMIDALTEFEITALKERQLDGIAAAKAAGVYGQLSLSKKDIDRLYAMVDEGVSKTEIAKEMKIARKTVYDYIKRRKESN